MIYTTSDEIQISGQKSIIIDNTLRLFKKDYWYILNYHIEHLNGSFNFKICDQVFLKNELNDQKILIKITQSELHNFLEIETLSNDSELIINKIIIVTLGLMNFGYLNIEDTSKGTLKNRYVQNDNILIPIDDLSERNITWDGRIVQLNNVYNHLERQTITKTFFRIISPILNIEEIQQLFAWIKRTYRRSVISNENLVMILGRENSSGNILIATESGKLLKLEYPIY